MVQTNIIFEASRSEMKFADILKGREAEGKEKLLRSVLSVERLRRCSRGSTEVRS